MSWRCSIHYWSVGPLDLHCFFHALDDSQRMFWVLGIGRREFYLWPTRSHYRALERQLLRPRMFEDVCR
jgi:hypothetical protein